MLGPAGDGWIPLQHRKGFSSACPARQQFAFHRYTSLPVPVSHQMAVSADDIGRLGPGAFIFLLGAQQTGFPHQWTAFQPAKNPTEFNDGAPLGQGRSRKSKHLRRLLPPLFHQGALILGLRANRS